MDEGRLGIVFRQEEQHRKFVYMMNDVVRSRYGLYSNCLAREQHETSVKLVKNCVEVRRSMVRQKVLRKCLEMRKRKIITRDPTTRFGQYGGKPLYAMSRDIDRVIADNHPRLRRMRRVQEVMRKSLESGAILDDDTVSRRMEAFFQLQQGRKRQEDTSPERPKDIFQSSPLRRNAVKLPAVPGSSTRGTTLLQSQSGSEVVRHKGTAADKAAAEDHQNNASQVEDTHLPDAAGKERRRSLETARTGVMSSVSLNVDPKGRLRGIRTNSIDTIVEQEDDVEEREVRREAGQKAEVDETGLVGRHSTQTTTLKDEDPSERPAGGEKRGSTDSDADGLHRQSKASGDKPKSKPRSKLILPPIQSSKALVSRT